MKIVLKSMLFNLSRCAFAATSLMFSCVASAQSLDPDKNLVLVTRGGQNVRISDVDDMLASAQVDQRADIVSTAARIEQLLDSRLLALQLVSRGRDLKLDQSSEVKRRLAIANDKALGEIILDMLVTQAASVDLESLAKETYATSKAEFIKPESWKVRHLLVKANNNEAPDAFTKRAEAAYVEATLPNADFESLVKLKSQDPSVLQNQGVFSVERKSEFVAEFLEATLKLKLPKQFAPLTKTEFGYHIIQLLEKSESKQLTFEEARPQLMASLNESFRERIKAEILSDLRSADPKYIEENIRKLVVRYDPPAQSIPVKVETVVPNSVPASGAPK